MRARGASEATGEAGGERKRTLSRDLARANQVALVTDEDYGSLRLRLSQEETELGRAMETAPVGHGEHQDTHFTLESRQVLWEG